MQESFRSTLYPLLKSPNCLPDAFVELEGGSRTALRLSVLKNVPFDETKGKSQGNLDEKWLKDIVAKVEGSFGTLLLLTHLFLESCGMGSYCWE